MARIRFVHPGLSTDEAYMAMTMAAKAAWPLIWTQCDDRGVFAWREKTLKAAIFPDDHVDFGAILTEWAALGVVLQVEIDGKPCGIVKNFCVYQTPKFPSYRHALTKEMQRFVGWDREKLNGKKIRIPEDEAAQATPILPQDCTRETPALPTYDNVYDNVEVEDNPPSIPPAVDGGTPAAPVRERSSISELEGFAEWWEAYPAEACTAPDYARKAYAKALQLGATPAAIMAALRRDIAQPGKRPPMAPAAWLKGGSWRMAEPAPSAPPAGNVAPIDHRFDGWEIADHMELGRWRSARGCGWRTNSESHNALSEEERRQALWDHLTGYRPRVARFLAQHEPDGIPPSLAA